MAVLNYVQDELQKNNLEWTPEGYLMCKNVGYAGVVDMKYHISELKAWGDVVVKDDADEKGMITVKRVADDLFSETCMSSIIGKDVTLRHPRQKVTVKNVKDLSYGTALTAVQDGDTLKGSIIIKDEKVAKAVYDGKYRGISLGYDSELVRDEGGTYRWSNSVNNHIALVSQPRNQRGFIGDEYFDDEGGEEQVNELTPLLQKVNDAIYKNDSEVVTVRHSEYDTETGEEIVYEITTHKYHSKQESDTNAKIGDEQPKETNETKEENITTAQSANKIEKEKQTNMTLDEFKKLDLLGKMNHFKTVSDSMPDSEAKEALLKQYDEIAKEIDHVSLVPKAKVAVGDEKKDPLQVIKAVNAVNDEQPKGDKTVKDGIDVEDEVLEMALDQYYIGLDPMNRAVHATYEDGIKYREKVNSFNGNRVYNNLKKGLGV